jgi:hypothetical protein
MRFKPFRVKNNSLCRQKSEMYVNKANYYYYLWSRGGRAVVKGILYKRGIMIYFRYKSDNRKEILAVEIPLSIFIYTHTHKYIYKHIH